MDRTSLCAWALAASAAAAGGSAARAAVMPPSGYIYNPLLLGAATQNCVAVGRGTTFVAVGESFTANGTAIVAVAESGNARLVALGFNSIGDCAYDADADVLYVSDNADNADLGITTAFGNTAAQSGDTVFAIDHASTASARLASGLELLPADSIEFVASLAIESDGDLLVGNAAGAGVGSVLRVAPGPMTSTVISGLNFTGGLAVHSATGDILVAESLPSFESQLGRYTAAGAVVTAPLLGPTFAFGTADLLRLPDGRYLLTGLFAGDVMVVDLAGPTSASFIVGLTYAGSASLNPFTRRLEILSSTFSGADEDKSVHRFVPIDRLVAGGDAGSGECLHEFYGIELVAASPGDVAKAAICVDGAACDADGVVNDSCRFPLGSCVNVDDPNLPECSPVADIQSFTLSAGRSHDLRDLTQTVAAALPSSGSRCFFSDGVTVPLKVRAGGDKKPGKAKVVVSVTNEVGEKDKDAVALVCQPAP